MEPAEIDWKNIYSHYELDEAYEHINAPKWLDLSASDAAVDDVAWFCRPNCRHPVTYEDFDRWNPSPKVKLLSSNSEAIRAGEQNNNQGDDNLKKRGGIASFFPSPSKPKLNSRKVREDLENQNPNMEATSLIMKEKKMAVAKKEAIKSSAEKKVPAVEEEVRETQSKRSQPQPRLKSTFSARNLFSGRDILSQISEFCHELKKLATGKESAATEEKEKEKSRKIFEKERGQAALKENTEEKKALVSTLKSSSLKKKCELAVRFDGSEEKNKILREARAYPPTPQRFPSPSSHRQLKSSKASANSNYSSPLSKFPKSKTQERGVLQELDQRREEKRELIPNNEECNRASVAFEAEGSTVDVFWFLKPCSYLS